MKRPRGPVTPAQRKARDSRLRLLFNISLAEYNKVAEFQDYLCGICKQPVAPGKTSLAMDHRHSDGMLRGLLCWKCNRALGAFHRFYPDNVDLFYASGDYLRNPTVERALGEVVYGVLGRVTKKARNRTYGPHGTKTPQPRKSITDAE